MFAIMVTEKGGDQRRHEYDKSEVTIGRVQGNDVILPKGNVSKRHARIVLKDGKFIIVDLKSTNGTYVNGRKITSPLVVKENDKIYIGDFIIGVEEAGGAGATAGAPMADPAMPDAPPWNPPSSGPPAPPPGRSARASAPPPPAPPPPDPPANLMAEPPAMRPTAQRPVAKPPPSLMDEPPPPPRSSPPKPPKPRTKPRTEPPLPPSLMDEPPPMMAEPTPPPPDMDRGSSPPARKLVGAGAPRSSAKVGPPPSLGPRGVQLEPLDPKLVKLLELQAEIHERLSAKLDLESVPPDELGDEDLWSKAESAIVDLVETLDSAGEVPNFVDQDTLIKESLNEALGLGPLEDLLADENVDEILVDRRDRIIVGKAGVLRGSGRAFSSDRSFQRVVERLVASSGNSIDVETPLVDLRLRDGSRLTAALPPVSVRGAVLTLRKPRATSQSLEALIGAGALSAAMGDFLETCIAARKNVLVSGAPDSGKSAIVSALAAAAPEGERVVTVEEVAELAIGRDNWIALEARPGDGNGVPNVDVQTVLRSALRMRPDRLVVGEVRGTEALELVQAMGSANDGAIASVAGEGGAAALARLTSMARLTAPGMSDQGLRELVACAVDVVVHVARYADGHYRVASIHEVLGATELGFQTGELFSFRGGDFQAAGAVPAFYADLEARGIPADTSIFR
jgi:pilus assembly protein CpaF